METEDMVSHAYGCGFDAACSMDPRTLEFLPAVRDMCAADKCNHYDKSWGCPPACGSLEEIKERCSPYKNGLLVQTIYRMADEYDFLAISDADSRHARNFNRLTKALFEWGLDMLPMGAGCCRICEMCTYPAEPCRFPHLVFPSMEACGLVVSNVCRDNDLPYYYGPDTIAFTSCYLY